jgi:putative ABC transport system permease protein
VPQVEAVSGEVVYHTLFTREGRRRSGKLVGVDTAYFGLLNLSLAQGSWFTSSHVIDARPVAIIGQGVRARFFTTEDPIGNSLKVAGSWVTVVGVLADRQVSTEASERLGIRDANMDVYIPVTTMLQRFRDRTRVTKQDIEAAARQYVVLNPDSTAEDEETRRERTNYHQMDRIVMRVGDTRYMGPVANVAQRLLQRRHNEVIDYEVTVPELLLKQEQRTKTIFNVVLGAIASISLIVGGIGIMNIMLASILERIREIGVRRAMGATRQNILAQFLSEAVMISVAGGLAGILVGGTLSLLIERFAGIQTLVSGISVAVAFGVSFTVGLVFGIVPAYRAAQQDPVVFLRYE